MGFDGVERWLARRRCGVLCGVGQIFGQPENDDSAFFFFFFGGGVFRLPYGLLERQPETVFINRQRAWFLIAQKLRAQQVAHPTSVFRLPLGLLARQPENKQSEFLRN